jgi:hypothetical protein
MGWSHPFTHKGEGIKVSVGSPWPSCTCAGSRLLKATLFYWGNTASWPYNVNSSLLKVILKTMFKIPIKVVF